jgi:hypothetical protein|tara:strand:- start:120 stop:512 length:393 start_codon:yes stop_codon:yes gene_type:complete
MLDKTIVNDKIGEFLVKRVNLTKPQLDTLLISLFNNDKLSNMVTYRDKGSVSKGSFIRTLKQARKNVESSLFTLIILEYFSIIEESHIINLIKIGNSLKKISINISVDDDIDTLLQQLTYAISDVCSIKK